MNILKLLIKLSRQKHQHFISVPFDVWKKYNILITLVMYFNKNYIPTQIFRKKYKNLRNFVVVGLKWNGKNVKRRTTGFAKEHIKTKISPKCIYCECDLNEENATADHIHPISDGGNNCQVNLVATCFDCNNERGNMDFMEYYRTKKQTCEKYIFI